MSLCFGKYKRKTLTILFKNSHSPFLWHGYVCVENIFMLLEIKSYIHKLSMLLTFLLNWKCLKQMRELKKGICFRHKSFLCNKVTDIPCAHPPKYNIFMTSMSNKKFIISGNQCPNHEKPGKPHHCTVPNRGFSK